MAGAPLEGAGGARTRPPELGGGRASRSPLSLSSAPSGSDGLSRPRGHPPRLACPAASPRAGSARRRRRATRRPPPARRDSGLKGQGAAGRRGGGANGAGAGGERGGRGRGAGGGGRVSPRRAKMHLLRKRQ